MNKHTLLFLLAGWLVSIVFPPTALFSMFKGVFGNAG